MEIRSKTGVTTMKSDLDGK